MPTAGPGVRALVESVVVAYATGDVSEAAVILKAVGRGVRLADMAPPRRQDELDGLVRAIGARAQTHFEDWTRETAAPEAEVREAVAVFEANVGRELAGLARTLTPADTAPETARALFEAAAAGPDRLWRDVVTRDICAALVGSALSAGADYAGPLAGVQLGLRASR